MLAGRIMTGIALAGAFDCGYLASVKLELLPLVCPADGGGAACLRVLSSPWASLGPVPLAVVGLAAYVLAAWLSLDREWPRVGLLWWLALAMASASSFLVVLLATVLHSPCPYCAFSALASAGLLVVAEVGQLAAKRAQPVAAPDAEAADADAGEGATDASVEADTLSTEGAQPEYGVGGYRPRLAVFAFVGLLSIGALWTLSLPGEDDPYEVMVERYKPNHPPVRSKSSAAEMALARHMAAKGAACYTAWWCPHCQEQRENFGAEGAALAPFVQCSTPERTPNDECKAFDIESYPTWIIDGKRYKGGYDLAELAKLTGFTEYPLDSFQSRDAAVTAYIWGSDEEGEEGA